MHPLVTLPALALFAGTAAPIGSAAAQEVCWTEGGSQFAAATHYCVTSVLPPQDGNTYGPRNLADGSSATAWCEGVRGNGIGEAITIRIDDGPPFRRLLIRNGYGKSSSVYADNGRIRTLAITTDTGVDTMAELVDQIGELPVYLPEPALRWVRLEIVDVYPGARFADTCLDFVTPDFEYEEALVEERQPQAPMRPLDTPGPPDTATEKPPAEPEELPDLGAWPATPE